jgi:RNA polymerase sigma factor (TIGR02999 family)
MRASSKIWGANMSDVTRILNAIDGGDAHAAERLLALVYDDLRQLAQQRLSKEKPGQTLQPTALVHEAYLRLVRAPNSQHWDGRGHFFAAAAEAMRRILVENARRKHRLKHGGNRQRVELCDGDLAVLPDGSDELLALDAALIKLAVEDPEASELVKLRFFTGLSIEQAGEMLGWSRATAYRNWDFARAWLRCAIEQRDEQ